MYWYYDLNTSASNCDQLNLLDQMYLQILVYFLNHNGNPTKTCLKVVYKIQNMAEYGPKIYLGWVAKNIRRARKWTIQDKIW